MSEYGMTPDERDRLTRMETKLDYVITNMTELPQSKVCQKEIHELHEVVKALSAKQGEHSDFIEGLKLKIGIVGSGFILLGTALTYVIKYVIEHLSFGWNTP